MFRVYSSRSITMSKRTQRSKLIQVRKGQRLGGYLSKERIPVPVLHQCVWGVRCGTFELVTLEKLQRVGENPWDQGRMWTLDWTGLWTGLWTRLDSGLDSGLGLWTGLDWSGLDSGLDWTLD